MSFRYRRFAPVSVAVLIAVTTATAAAPRVTFTDTKLKNGLRVILAEDHNAPVFSVAVTYNVGSRDERQGRTGFAHLFEHMMFKGSEQVGPGEHFTLIFNNGGNMNGTTSEDRTLYFETLPANQLDLGLFLEADRMWSLDINKDNLDNQRNAVQEERRLGVDNVPYGKTFEAINEQAYKNFAYSHSVIGSMADLNAADVSDVRAFFKTYYAPNNAVLVIVGDFEPSQAKAWVHKYFDDVPSSALPAKLDISEPKQDKEKRASKDDKLATRPALAIAYHVPARNTPEYYAMGLLDQVLVQGKDSRLYQALVQRAGVTGDVQGGINSGLGDMFNVNGPTLWDASLFHDKDKSVDEILKVFDGEIDRVRQTPVDEATRDRALVKVRSALYDKMEQFGGFGKADLLASFALFDDDPNKINQIEREFRKVTPQLMQKTAQDYLRPENRTILVIEPRADEKAAPKAESK